MFGLLACAGSGARTLSLQSLRVCEIGLFFHFIAL